MCASRSTDCAGKAQRICQCPLFQEAHNKARDKCVTSARDIDDFDGKCWSLKRFVCTHKQCAILSSGDDCDIASSMQEEFCLLPWIGFACQHGCFLDIRHEYIDKRKDRPEIIKGWVVCTGRNHNIKHSTDPIFSHAVEQSGNSLWFEPRKQAIASQCKYLCLHN